jgi:hypothetical protein
MRNHRLFLVLITLLCACGGSSKAASFVAFGSSNSTITRARKPVVGTTGDMIERSTKWGSFAPIATLDVAVESYLDADPMFDVPHAPGAGSPAPATRTWVKVPGGLLLESRTAGDNRIEPDDETRAELAKAGRRRASGTFRLCFDGQGAVVLARTLIETGSPAYDEKILRELRTWKFRPHVIDGEPYGVCSEVSVSYP